MNFEELYTAACKAIHSITDVWIFKITVASLAPLILGLHGQALAAFVALVFVDLATKWVAICYQDLTEQKKVNNLLQCIAHIPEAIKAGVISSSAMKHRFVSKIFVYLILVIVAVNTDELIEISAENPVLLKVTLIYLALTEAVSILENLRDAGFEQANALLVFLREKTSLVLEKFKK